MNSKTTRTKNTVRQAVIEITETDLFLVVLEGAAEGPKRASGRHLIWRQDAESLYSDDGAGELATALASLIQELNLAGAAIHAILSSDYCVTRVFTGDTDAVREEIQAVQERSRLYLSLGPGPKAHALMSRPIDTKRQQAWVSVANERVVSAICRAAHEAGIQLRSLAHGLCAVCHSVGQTRRDAEKPVILIEADHRSVEMGISFKGQLLLDYRPVGGHAVKDEVVQIAYRHLKRLQRYCGRHIRKESTRISEVILFGPEADLHNLKRQFPAHGELEPLILYAQDVQPDWEFDRDFPRDSRFVAALGALLALQAQQPIGPDLLEKAHQRQTGPVLPRLLKVFWPAAAALLLSLGAWGAALVQHQRCAAVEDQLQQYRPQQLRVEQLRMEVTEIQNRLRHLRTIEAQISHPPWHQLIVHIGACLPQGVWLDQLRADETGTLAIIGPSHSEDGIYEFVRHLKTVPELKNVALESTKSVRLNNGPATLFGVKCTLADSPDHNKKS